MQIELSNSELVEVINSLRDQAHNLRKAARAPFVSGAFIFDWTKKANRLDALARRICLDAGIQP